MKRLSKNCHRSFRASVSEYPILLLFCMQVGAMNQSKKEVESLKAIAARQFCTKILVDSVVEQKANEFPSELKEVLVDQLKTLEWDRLCQKACIRLPKLDKKVVNFNNTYVAGIAKKDGQDCVMLANDKHYVPCPCESAAGSPIEMIAWHPRKNDLAVAQNGFWILDSESNHTYHLDEECLRFNLVKKIGWDPQGQRFFVANYTDLYIFPPDFYKQKSFHVDHINFDEDCPMPRIITRPSAEDVISGNAEDIVFGRIEYCAWTPSGKKMVVSKKMRNEIQLMLIDVQKKKKEWSKNVRRDLAVLDHDEDMILTEKYNNLTTTYFDKEHRWKEEYIEHDAEYGLLRAKLLTDRFVFIVQWGLLEDGQSFKSFIYDRMLKKRLSLPPAHCKGYLALTADKKYIYGNAPDDSLIDLTYISGQPSLEQLLAYLKTEKTHDL